MRTTFSQLFLMSIAIISTIHLAAESYTGEVQGYTGDMNEVSVTLENKSVLLTTQPDKLGSFEFSNLENGRYFVKVNAPGYSTTPARTVYLPLDDPQDPYVLTRLNEDDFVFHWEEDQSTAGLEYSSRVIKPVTVEILGDVEEISDTSVSGHLLYEYNVALLDDEVHWTNEHSHRLHQMMAVVATPRQLHLRRADFYADSVYSRWTLTSERLPDDIELTLHEDGTKDVRISMDAFANASPKIVEIEDRRGIWYSQRLHHAVVRVVTNNGENREETARILKDRFGVELDPDYDKLTSSTTGETNSSFQQFNSEELINLINIMEEMPQGLHTIPNLNYIVRRINGTKHPLYPTAPAVAWPGVGYIEFMESAFKESSLHYIHRLILHEKAHFIWSEILDERTRDDWIELGQWYEDPLSSTGWSTKLTTQFVSAYAHQKNPDEDMAESIADFVVNPDILRARAPGKYEFIRDRIMAGTIYVSKIREDLTFEVYNLYPDYVYPGKIRSVDVRVEGKSEQDKKLSVEIKLHALDLDTEGAHYGILTLYSDVGTRIIMHLRPLDEDGNFTQFESTVLRAEHEISKYSKAGYWIPDQILLMDQAQNSRYSSSNTFEMKVYVNNALEDYFEPTYVLESIELSNERRYLENDRQEVQIVTISWDVDEDRGLTEDKPCQAYLNPPGDNVYSLFQRGKHTNSSECSVDFTLPHYMRSGLYTVQSIEMRDKALNKGQYQFLADGDEQIPEIEIVTENEDWNPPELDINNIFVKATPTNTEQPDGETLLEIKYLVRDDNSGFKTNLIYLRDPHGSVKQRWHFPLGSQTLFSTDGANQWKFETLNWILPKGSIPGIWGIQEMMVVDRASNTKRYSFTENVRIDVLNMHAPISSK